MTLRQSIEANQHGSFVTRLYAAYNALRDADNLVRRAVQVADMSNRRKMEEAIPGCTSEDGWDTNFLIRKMEEQFPALLHLDDETDDPHQFRF